VLDSIIYVGGIAGIDKPAILRKAAAILRKSSIKAELIDVEKLMLDYAKKRGYAKLPDRIRKSARLHAFRTAIRTKNSVVCGCFCPLVGSGEEAFPYALRHHLRPLILINPPKGYRTKPQVLKLISNLSDYDLNARLKDPHIERLYAAHLAAENGCELYVVDSRNAVRQVAAILRKHLKKL